MICAYCKSDIEKDSLFCDQCGMELFICPNCNQPRKGKRCSEDGGILFSPRLNSLSNSVADLKKDTYDRISPIMGNTSPTPLIKPILKLINRNLNIDIEIKEDTIIGSKEGRYINIFSKFSEISGKHISLKYDSKNGWTVTDIGSDGRGSTNGTKVNNSPVWDKVKRLEPNTPLVLYDNSYILLAKKYEFFIKIIHPMPSTPSGTIRV
jgi:hypothetical protein